MQGLRPQAAAAATEPPRAELGMAIQVPETGGFSMERLGVWTSSWGHGKQRWKSMDKLAFSCTWRFFRMIFQQKLGFTVIDLLYLL